MNLSRRGFLGAAAGVAGGRLWGQEGQRPVFRVKVDMVVLSFTITDSRNRYINGLKPSDFRILEDGILQRIATFAEGARPPVAVLEDGSTRPLIEGRTASESAGPGLDTTPDAFVGTNVFVLFDTSNFMYRGFVYAEDAIADIDLGPFAELSERERLVVNVHTAYRHLDPTTPGPDVIELFRQMATYR